MTTRAPSSSPSSSAEWPTLLMLVATYALWALGVMAWEVSGALSILATAWFCAQFSSLQHEALHGHPTASPLLNEALVFPALTLVVPYRRFRDTHLQHHHDPILTDPYDDPESNFVDPAVWPRVSAPLQALMRFNNTLLGRLTVGPAMAMTVWLWGEARLMARGRGDVILAWGLCALGWLPVLWWLDKAGMPLWAYLSAAYIGQSLLRIRTFLEHRAHEAARARTVVIEDRGPFALLFLNNNFHAVHHMHPGVAWYRLPALYAARKEHFLRRNDGYVYPSYAEVFRRYFFHAKDPVPHPVWPVNKGGAQDPAGPGGAG